MKPLAITWVLAALALCASSCSDGDSIGYPVTRPPPPFGTEPSPVTGSEPTTGGNDPLPQPEASLQALCSAACVRLQNECPGAGGSNCASECTSSGMSYPRCASQFRAFVACLGTAPLECNAGSIAIPACSAAQTAFGNCLNATGR
jgi:hypothetical protein